VKVFLSYPYRDHEVAEEVRQALTVCGAEVVSAEAVAVGDSLSNAIASGVAAADAFVVLMTRNSGASQWSLLELGAAVASGKPVIPVLAEDGAEIPLIVRDRIYLDIRDPSRRSAAFRQLCEALAAPRDVRRQQSIDGLDAITHASAALEVERKAYERSSRQHDERLQRVLVLVAVIAVIASVAGLLVAGGSHTPGLTAVATGIAAALAGVFGFYFGSSRRTDQGD
jgi:hypothetical protein